MRYALAAAALACSSPAWATGGFECKPVAGAGPTLIVGIGHGLSPRPFSVWIREGQSQLAAPHDGGGPLVLGQTWIDSQYLWIDLLDPQRNRFEAKLRATFQPKLKGRPAIGTLVRDGRTWRVRCIEA
ncbi:MAG TPA: hypothetical protein VD846_04505 [Allosphingosinicella sp.]|nr:hypothetical protein [Allosphingosinicella sp.]